MTDIGVLYHRIDQRRLVLIIGLILVTALSLIFDLAVGPSDLSMKKILTGLMNPGLLSTAERVVLFEVRMPAALIALGVGACLGLAGAEMQTVLNNPLASPYTLGISWAAMLGAVLSIVFGLDQIGFAPTLILPLSAFIGAGLAGLGIQLVSQIFGARAETVILFGIALVFLCSALIAILQFIADATAIQRTVFWHMGILSRATLAQSLVVIATFCVIAPFAMGAAWSMTVLRGGEEQAASFGLSVGRFRRMALFRASLLTAVAVSFVGPIGFIGLVGPHIARLLFGENHRYSLPGAVVTGAFLLSLASVASKSIVPGIIIPVGIVTTLLGLPIFLTLVILQRRPG